MMDEKDCSLVDNWWNWVMNTWRFIILSAYFCTCMIIYIWQKQKQKQLVVPVRCFGSRNLSCQTQAMKKNSIGHEDHIRDPGSFSLRQSTGCSTLSVSLIHVQQEVLATAHRPPWLANKKSKAMRLSITTSFKELRLMSIASRENILLLITSARVNAKFLTIVFLYTIPMARSTSLIVHMNSESVILLDSMPE